LEITSPVAIGSLPQKVEIKGPSEIKSIAA